MLNGRPWLFALVSATILIASCERESPLAPNEPALSSSGGSTFRLTATPISHTQIDLAWKDVSTSETGYEVWRSGTGASGPFALVASTPRNTITYSDGGLTASTEYCYRVREFRRKWWTTTYSKFSSTVCASTKAAPPPPPGPAAPTGLNARPLDLHANSVIVTWNDNSNDEEAFRFERATSEQGPWEHVATLPANSISRSDHNRPFEQRQCYRVTAVRGEAQAASNIDCTYLPNAPTALAVTSVSGQAVELAWTDNSAVEDGFVVQRSSDGSPFTTVGTVAADVTTFRDGTVTADKTYLYWVRVTREGVITGASNSIKVITASAPPAAPSAVSVSPSGSTGVGVYWTDNSVNEAGFRVERSENGGATWAEAGKTEVIGFYDGGRTPEREVCYRVLAFNSVGDSPPSPMDCTIPPAAPTSLVATAAPGLVIDLTWSDNSSVEVGYMVQRLAVSGCYGYVYYCYPQYEVIANLGPNVTSYRDVGLASGQPYTYVVYAVAEGGYSDPSEEYTAYPDLPPAAPSNLTAAAPTSTRIDLAWSDNSDNEFYFTISRCTGDATVCDGTQRFFAALASVGSNVTTFSDGTAQPNTTYTYVVTASNSVYTSAWSNRASVTTPP